MPPAEAPKSRVLIPLNLGLAFLFSLIVIITATLVGLSTFKGLQRYVRADLKDNLRSAVTLASFTIDPVLHATLQKPEDEALPAFAQVQARLRKVRDTMPQASFVYTYRKDAEGRVVFVVDAEDSEEERSKLGDVYEDTTPSMLKVFDKPHKTQVEDEFSTDKWGTWMSSFAPILGPDGELEAVVGVDSSAEQILSYERKYLAQILTASIVIALFVLTLGLLLTRRVIRSLKMLEDGMSRIQRFDLSKHDMPPSVLREVVSMQGALENMRRGLRSFRRYVPADLVGELIELKKEAVLGSEKKELSFLFSDIIDFTAISERLGPENLVLVLSRYFQGTTEAIIGNHGTIDKYIGDAIMAFWGAPKELNNHAHAACQAALDVQAASHLVNGELEAKGFPALRTRIGVHTGEAFVGNIGYEERLSYTVLGDNVNLASRLEGLNKLYGTSILISDATRRAAGPVFLSRLIDRVVVKGKSIQVDVFELMGRHENASAADSEFSARHARAMDAYFARQWAAARTLFLEQLAIRAEDGPSKLLLARCDKYLGQDPGAGFTGVIHLEDK